MVRCDEIAKLYEEMKVTRLNSCQINFTPETKAFNIKVGTVHKHEDVKKDTGRYNDSLYSLQCKLETLIHAN